MARVQATATIDIAKPPAEVFAYLTDVRRHGEWSPKPYRVEGLPAGTPVVKGLQFSSYGWLPNDKDHHNLVEVTELEPPTRLVLDALDGGEHYVSTFTVTASGGGSRLQRVMDMPKPSGVVGVLFPILLRALIVPDVKKGLAKLKTNVEAGLVR